MVKLYVFRFSASIKLIILKNNKMPMHRKILVINQQSRINPSFEQLFPASDFSQNDFDFSFISGKKDLGHLIRNVQYAVILLFISAEQPEIDLEITNNIRFKFKELNARILAVFSGKLSASIENYISDYPIDGYIIEDGTNHNHLNISLTLATRNFERIIGIKEDFERSRLIKKFSNLHSQIQGTNHFIDAAYKKLLEDKNIKNVALFHGTTIIKCSGHKTAFTNVHKLWEKSNSEVIGNFIYLRIREFDNHLLAVETHSPSKKTNPKFSVDLLRHATAVRENIIHLVKNDRLLLDLYFISTNSNQIVWVEAKGRKVNLHFGESETEFVNQPLKTVFQFFGEDYLLQINRSILINTGKIRKIQRLTSRNMIIEMTTGEAFSVARSNIKKIEELFPEKIA